MSDLDVFVEQGVAAEPFELYLQQDESYALESTTRSQDRDGTSDYHMYSIVEVRNTTLTLSHVAC